MKPQIKIMRPQIEQDDKTSLCCQKEDAKDDDELITNKLMEKDTLSKESVSQVYINHNQSSINSWDYHNQYSQFFKSISTHNQQSLFQNQEALKLLQQNLHKKLLSSKFFILNNHQINSTQESHSIKIKVIQATKGIHASKISCHLGPFTKNYTVLNLKKQSHRHFNTVIGFGTYGKIYHCQQYKDTQLKSVIKCLKYDDENFQIIRNHIKEFFIYDLMSALQIGPKILKKKGFDFIILKNCIEFEMQRCQHLFQPRLEKDIKQSILSMHLLQFIHSDIKPSNIMFSQQFGKNVLIDFGTAQYTSVGFGAKVNTKYRGTYEYSGQEMKKIFFENKNQLIDLYKNDVQMLQNTLKSTNKQKSDSLITNNIENKQKDRQEHQCLQFQVLVQLKYCLYQNQYMNSLSDETLNILQRIINNFSNNQIIRIIYQSLNFAINLQQRTIYTIARDFLWKNSKINSLDFSSIQLQIQQKQQNLVTKEQWYKKNVEHIQLFIRYSNRNMLEICIDKIKI